MSSVSDSLAVAQDFSYGGSFNGPANTVPAQAVYGERSASYATGLVDVATITIPVAILRKDGLLLAFEIACITAPAGGDKAFTVDLQKGNQAGAFATVLAAAVTINSSVASREVKVGTINTASLADGDTLRLVITASGTTGSQGQGLCVTTTWNEKGA